MTVAMRPEQLVVSVEHASLRVPAALGDLDLPASFLDSHHAWDPGAAAVGRHLAREFAAPLHLGRWSRLVADLNRSSSHPRVIPRDSGDRRIPRNENLARRDRRDRLDRYWSPYRSAVEADLDACVVRFGRVLHVSVHTFTPELNGEVRNNDFGLLYQPSHRGERAMADRWDRRLTALGFRVRRNYPYSGLDDGFCMRMRAARTARSYLGMEIEMNQDGLRTRAARRRFAEAVVGVVGREFHA